MPRRRWILFVTLLALVGACSAPSGPVTSSDGRSIVIGAGSEPDNLNPILGFAPDGASKIFDGLVARDANLALVPALAEQVPTASPDGLTWTATLRPGVTFSDGSPLTVSDVVFTFQSVLDRRSTRRSRRTTTRWLT
jgi:peptide/nickel transport system substrate-binding protein